MIRITDDTLLTDKDVWRFLWYIDFPAQPEDCWLWNGSRNRSHGRLAYGCLRMRGKTRPAHRISYEYFHGPVPKGKFVCHRCDNPPCVNPAHLFAGTDSENKIGMRKDLTGEKHPRSKLTDRDVKVIRWMYDGGWKPKDMAVVFPVDASTLCQIGRRKRWRHVA